MSVYDRKKIAQMDYEKALIFWATVPNEHIAFNREAGVGFIKGEFSKDKEDIYPE